MVDCPRNLITPFIYYSKSNMERRDSEVEFNYERAKHLKGKMVRFRDKDGEWVVGKVVGIKKDGLEIAELDSSRPNGGDGFGFPFFNPFFVPFDGFFFDPFFFFF